MKLKCELIVNSDTEHLQQIYTGFSLLHGQRIISLKQTIPKEFLKNKNQPGRWVDYKFLNTKLIINDKISVCYDAHDWNWIDKEILKEVDFYFKRSYDPSFISTLSEKHKIFPLGLNYQVTGNKADFFRLQRTAFFTGKDRVKQVIKSLRLDNFLQNTEVERLDKMESEPNISLAPRVLFMARAWSTADLPDQSQIEKVNEINSTRAESIRILRDKFGKRFFGGLMPDEFSKQHFEDVVLPDRSLSNKRNYLKILKDFPICIATTGLNNSIGWKFAEYTAFSKAIITEPLKFQIPGDFAKNKNYLEFTNSRELVDAVTQLLENDQLRHSMMRNNFDYYQKFVRPDKLVLNSLIIVANHRGISLL